MKKLLLLVVCLSFLLLGCNSAAEPYPFENRDEPITAIELLYYPWIENENEPFMEFVLIRELSIEEIPLFMEELYALPSSFVLGSPLRNYGLYIAKVSYENGDTEYFASRHNELVKAGEEPYAVGVYRFIGDSFDELFLEYAGNIDGIIK